MTEIEHRCILCGQLAIDGIRLRGKLICSKCEKEILKTRANEPAYENYKQGLKVIWHGELKSISG